MDAANAFEWELSKENVSRLHGGRSVALLNKVLSSLHTEDFQRTQNHLKRHFELNLNNLPNSFVKLRLYLRYIHWIEQTNPSMHRSTDFETLLFRCVRDCGQLPNVKNDEDFVAVWIRLTEYCDQPGELFELLFRQGVGTMCTKFYEAWANWLCSHSQFARAASVYAHGLRAGAQSLIHLEDHAEMFVARLRAHITADHSREHGVDFNASSDASVNLSSTRQTLAALSLVQRESDPDSTDPKVPVVRTSHVWHTDQSGLRTSKNISVSNQNSRALPRVNLKPVSKTAEVENDAAVPLYTLPAASERTSADASGDSEPLFRPLGHPTAWQKENVPKATTWTSQRLTSSGVSSAPPRSQPEWRVYSEKTNANEPTDGPLGDRNRLSNGKPATSSVGKRKGLVVLRDAPQQSSLVPSTLSSLRLPTFIHFLDAPKPICADGVDSSERLALLQRVDLPSLPVDHLPNDAEFSFPLNLIYGGAEEMCWEMHRGTRWISDFGDSACVDTPAHRGLWDTESEAILDEIATILRCPDAPKFGRPEDISIAVTGSSRAMLIKELDQIASGKMPTQKPN
ncbi:unnamed protein product [Dicrocoelium dendriticum]|nr:unnamed protein product [Dicrocoelium dendriticum]